jgi:hypothetical protein
MIWFSGFCFGFSLAVFLNSRFAKKETINKLINSISHQEKHKAFVPKKEEEWTTID